MQILHLIQLDFSMEIIIKLYLLKVIPEILFRKKIGLLRGIMKFFSLFRNLLFLDLLTKIMINKNFQLNLNRDKLKIFNNNRHNNKIKNKNCINS